eukprot:GEMP01001308.1.p1 GENE.GEMP01001308.1~~GEMP01001308.1.p1  ORF type:complete len:1381 (+),score=335.23 GEMP01001308.1:85-4227(+)
MAMDEDDIWHLLTVEEKERVRCLRHQATQRHLITALADFALYCRALTACRSQSKSSTVKPPGRRILHLPPSLPPKDLRDSLAIPDKPTVDLLISMAQMKKEKKLGSSARFFVDSTDSSAGSQCARSRGVQKAPWGDDLHWPFQAIPAFAQLEDGLRIQTRKSGPCVVLTLRVLRDLERLAQECSFSRFGEKDWARRLYGDYWPLAVHYLVALEKRITAHTGAGRSTSRADAITDMVHEHIANDPCSLPQVDLSVSKLLRGISPLKQFADLRAVLHALLHMAPSHGDVVLDTLFTEPLARDDKEVKRLRDSLRITVETAEAERIAQDLMDDEEDEGSKTVFGSAKKEKKKRRKKDLQEKKNRQRLEEKQKEAEKEQKMANEKKAVRETSQSNRSDAANKSATAQSDSKTNIRDAPKISGTQTWSEVENSIRDAVDSDAGMPQNETRKTVEAQTDTEVGPTALTMTSRKTTSAYAPIAKQASETEVQEYFLSEELCNQFGMATPILEESEIGTSQTRFLPLLPWTNRLNRTMISHHDDSRLEFVLRNGPKLGTGYAGSDVSSDERFSQRSCAAASLDDQLLFAGRNPDGKFGYLDASITGSIGPESKCSISVDGECSISQRVERESTSGSNGGIEVFDMVCDAVGAMNHECVLDFDALLAELEKWKQKAHDLQKELDALRRPLGEQESNRAVSRWRILGKLVLSRRLAESVDSLRQPGKDVRNSARPNSSSPEVPSADSQINSTARPTLRYRSLSRGDLNMVPIPPHRSLTPLPDPRRKKIHINPLGTTIGLFSPSTDASTQTAPAVTLSKIYGSTVPSVVQKEIARLRQQNQFLRYRAIVGPLPGGNAGNYSEMGSMHRGQNDRGRPQDVATQTQPAITLSKMWASLGVNGVVQLQKEVQLLRQENQVWRGLARRQSEGEMVYLPDVPQYAMKQVGECSSVAQMHYVPQYTIKHREEKVEEEERNPGEAHFLRLRADIADLERRLTGETMATEDARAAIFRNVTRVVKNTWPRSNLQLYGSYAVGLAIPTSDLDLVITDEGVNKKTWQSVLARKLSEPHETWVLLDSINQISNTAIPILTFVAEHTMASGQRTRVQVDVSLDGPHHNGLAGLEAISYWLETLPLLRPIVLVLKLFLQKHSLATSYTGGLSSYGLANMVTCYLLHSNDDKLEQAFLGFFKCYGQQFNTRIFGVSVVRAQFVRRDGSDWKDVLPQFLEKGWGKPRCLNSDSHPYDPMFIEDPLNPSNNISRNCFRIKQIQKVFDKALETLLQDSDISRIMCTPLHGMGDTHDTGHLVAHTREHDDPNLPYAVKAPCTTRMCYDNGYLPCEVPSRDANAYIQPNGIGGQQWRSEKPFQWDSAVGYQELNGFKRRVPWCYRRDNR